MSCFCQEEKTDSSGSVVPYFNLEGGIGIAKARYSAHPSLMVSFPNSTTGPTAVLSLGIRHDTLPFFAECAGSYWSRGDFASLSILSIGTKIGFEIAQTSPFMGRISGNLGWFKGTARVGSSGMYRGASLDLFSNQGASRHGITLSYMGIGKIKVAEATTYSPLTTSTTISYTGYGTYVDNKFQPGAPNGTVPVMLSMSEFRITYTISISPSRKPRKSSPKDSTLEPVRFH